MVALSFQSEENNESKGFFSFRPKLELLICLIIITMNTFYKYVLRYCSLIYGLFSVCSSSYFSPLWVFLSLTEGYQEIFLHMCMLYQNYKELTVRSWKEVARSFSFSSLISFRNMQRRAERARGWELGSRGVGICWRPKANSGTVARHSWEANCGLWLTRS